MRIYPKLECTEFDRCFKFMLIYIEGLQRGKERKEERTKEGSKEGRKQKKRKGGREKRRGNKSSIGSIIRKWALGTIFHFRNY